MKIRSIETSDYRFLDEFLYQAIYIPPGEALPTKSIIFTPEIYIYAKDFGSQKGDHGVVAEIDNNIIGMAWTRIIPAYGHINDNIPELAISILPEYRGKGNGTKLMYALFDILKKNDYEYTSLSVQKDNPAVTFYLRLCYQITEERPDFAGHEDYIMIKELK